MDKHKKSDLFYHVKPVALIFFMCSCATSQNKVYFSSAETCARGQIISASSWSQKTTTKFSNFHKSEHFHP